MRTPSPRTVLVLSLTLLIFFMPLSHPWLLNFWSIPSVLDCLTDMPQKAALLSNSSCSPKIPSGHCCSLLIETEPCKQECRKKYVNRVTMAESKEFAECTDVCLKTYRKECEVQVGK
ncbi:uncharacterized protein BDZ99DRAFT_457479 [Mytilinidion resinicola]|uniref:Uncharacterized protein n=1 Tax=Mytilinidion resinicola TaxID=574789 RepID=A0A6A6Z9Q2_9PEZI|nr:uncharacterized protein BDZ99DRAFT_457479 [Mytilinidion resinicola]KAF2817760.1 hypothetical protein BDZ99DRAFT_457479 [Mytilinidion resinicola]